MKYSLTVDTVEVFLRSCVVVVVVLPVLFGCASPSQDIVIPTEQKVVQRVPNAGASPAPTTQSSGGPQVAGVATSINTQNATYVASGFAGVPGWGTDSFSESWAAFSESCRVLSLKVAEWKTLCARSAQVNAGSNDSVRKFFETEFVAYQVQDERSKNEGVVTGYFETDLKGSRRYGAPYIYPVYGVPSDMLYLDSRNIDRSLRSQKVAARLDGRTVVLQQGLTIKDTSGTGTYLLDLSTVGLDTLDKRVRLRVEGRQLVSYYTRQEIDALGAPNAKVIAFVDDVLALYEMQIQGAGRINLSTGERIQVSYAEQNGHPFRPTVAGNAKSRTRGREVELEPDDEDEGLAGIRTRGFNLSKPAPGGKVAATPVKAGAPRASGSGISDPSYVFFNEAAVSNKGPVGALGVPLQAGRSIAVDPRTTPLGYPVFVSTKDPASGKPLQRLTVAQDTGGAIRGAVRADYFFGNGPAAAASARRMKERGQMWVLLPRGMKVAGGVVANQRTRGSGGSELPMCLIETEQACIEDRAD
jgi:membrane-bound lytic murein transglycosylase A